MCRLAILENDEMKTYSCSEVLSLKEQWKTRFREENGTDKILSMGMKDERYEEYSKSIDSFLDKCDCEAHTQAKCHKCRDEEHEGNGFCRCETRNIKRAKYLREIGQSWNKQKEDRAEGESHRERLSEKTSKEGAIV